MEFLREILVTIAIILTLLLIGTILIAPTIIKWKIRYFLFKKFLEQISKK